MGSRIGAVEVCTGRREDGDVGGVVGLGQGAHAEEEEGGEGHSVLGDAVVLEDVDRIFGEGEGCQECVGLVEV